MALDLPETLSRDHSAALAEALFQVAKNAVESMPIAELARVIAPGGRAVVVDQVCSEDAHEAELYERLESMRDPSHVRTLPDSEIRQLLFDAGLVVDFGREVHGDRTAQRVAVDQARRLRVARPQPR